MRGPGWLDNHPTPYQPLHLGDDNKPAPVQVFDDTKPAANTGGI